MKFEKLGNVCDFQGGTQPPKNEWSNSKKDGYIRMLQIRDFTQRDNNHVEYVKDSPRLNKCYADDILIGRYGASVGKILTGLSGAYNVAIIKTIPNKEKLVKPYLYYFLLNPTFQNFIKNIGGRAAQAGFNKEDISNFQIPLPPLPDQIKITTVLSKAEALIQKKKENISLLDEFLKNTFLKMFGDPVRNEKRWEMKEFGSCLSEIISGSSSTDKIPPNVKEDSEAKILKVSSVTWGEFNPNEFKLINSSQLGKKLITPSKGDLLFSRANTRELVGATCVVRQNYPDLFLPDKLWILKLKNDIVNYYIHFLFKNSKFNKILTRDATGSSGSMLNISMEKLRSIIIPLPPPALQNEFAAIVEKTEALKEKLKSSLVDLENLYGSLSQKAFNGELDLSNIEIDTSLLPKIESDSQKKEIHKMQFFSEKIEKKIPEKKPKDKSIQPLLDWGKVSSQQVADWIKEEFGNYHFNSEMLTNYLLKEKVNRFDYFTSEELLKNLKLNAADDLKSFVFSSLAGENPFLKLEQIFYNAEREDKNLQLREEDYKLIQKKSKPERSGIYFRIV